MNFIVSVLRGRACLGMTALGLIHFLFKLPTKIIYPDTDTGDCVILSASILLLSTKLNPRLPQTAQQRKTDELRQDRSYTGS